MRIDHAAIYVSDPEKARDFFVKYFEGASGKLYRNEKTAFRSYFVSFEDGARLEIMYRPDRTPPEEEPPRTGYAHVAFSVGSREKVDELTARLKADGFEVLSGPRTTGDGYYESCVAAAEGWPVEITV